MTSSPRIESSLHPEWLTPAKIEVAAAYFADVSTVLTRLPYSVIDQVAEIIFQAYVGRHTILLFGNGGSAALASHLACDLGKGTAINGGERLRVLALTDNIPLITAWANDSHFEEIFAEQMRNVVRPRDVALAISGSGNSRNVIRALEVARAAGAYTIGFGGFQGGKMSSLCDVCVIVPSENMQVIEDMHLSISHCVFTAVREQIANLSRSL